MTVLKKRLSDILIEGKHITQKQLENAITLFKELLAEAMKASSKPLDRTALK